MIISLAVAFIAIAVAVASWFRPPIDDRSTPAAPPPQQHSVQEIAAAKQAICKAHQLIDRATDHAASRTSDDPAIRGLLSLNVRIGAVVSSNYIAETAVSLSATPSELIDSVRKLAIAYNNTTLLQISDATDAELNQAYAKLDAADAEVSQACE